VWLLRFGDLGGPAFHHHKTGPSALKLVVSFTLNFPTGDDEPTYFDPEKTATKVVGYSLLECPCMIFVRVCEVLFQPGKGGKE
jgi:hypothetical protein